MKELNSYQKYIIRDKQFLENKNQIFEKINEFFLELKSQFEKDFCVNSELFKRGNYKVVKGEYLNLMPYMAFDYPRFTSKSEFVIVRRLFWWGHGWFSFLHYSSGFEPQLNETIKNLKEDHSWKWSLPQNQFHYPDYLKLSQELEAGAYPILYLSYGLESTLEYMHFKYLQEYELLKPHLELLRKPD